MNQEGPAGTQPYQHHSTQYTVTLVSRCIMMSISGFLPARLSVQGRQVHLSLPTRHKYADSYYNSLFCISYLLIYYLSIHTHLGAHWPRWPFMSLHSWESHITLESWKSTFTLRSTDHQLDAQRDGKILKTSEIFINSTFSNSSRIQKRSFNTLK